MTNDGPRLTFTSRQIARTRLHLLEHLLRPDIPPCSSSNILSLLRLFEPDVFQPMSHVEPVVPASIVEVQLISPEPFRRLFGFCSNRDQSVADVEDIVPKWLQRRDTGSDRDQAFDPALERLWSPHQLGLIP